MHHDTSLQSVQYPHNGTRPQTIITCDEINDEINRCNAEAASQACYKGMLIVRTADEWMEEAARRPMPHMLFSEFWFEGELCILFADTNLGKSILAVQIADSIARGAAIAGFKLEAEAQPVIYCDFELSAKQFEVRYTGPTGERYCFGENFGRAELNPNEDVFTESGFQDFESFLYASLERSVMDTGARVLIIDNITYLKNETEQARFALPLMKQLKMLKEKYGLSILTLAHTPKRDLSKPLTRNDVQGSKMLINFCDSAFAIGESSTDTNIRYLKHIKVRNCEHIFTEDHVCVCQITKRNNFLQFDFLNYGAEREHLRQVSEDERSEFEKAVRDLMEETPGISSMDISRKLCDDESKLKNFNVKVWRTMNRLKESK